MGDKRKVHSVLGGKPEGKIPLGRHRHRRKDNIKVGFK
jgi:hypothetical protein